MSSRVLSVVFGPTGEGPSHSGFTVDETTLSPVTSHGTEGLGSRTASGPAPNELKWVSRFSVLRTSSFRFY